MSTHLEYLLDFSVLPLTLQTPFVQIAQVNDYSVKVSLPAVRPSQERSKYNDLIVDELHPHIQPGFHTMVPSPSPPRVVGTNAKKVQGKFDPARLLRARWCSRAMSKPIRTRQWCFLASKINQTANAGSVPVSVQFAWVWGEGAPFARGVCCAALLFCRGRNRKTRVAHTCLFARRRPRSPPSSFIKSVQNIKYHSKISTVPIVTSTSVDFLFPWTDVTGYIIERWSIAMARRVFIYASLALIGLTFMSVATTASSSTLDASMFPKSLNKLFRWDSMSSVFGHNSSFKAQFDREQNLRRIFEENEWKNSLVMWVLPERVRDVMPHWAQSWFRCWFLCAILYFGVSGAWAYYTYVCFGDRLYPPGHIPGAADILEQIKIALMAMPLYAALPALTEAVVEKGWTLSYARIADVGVGRYLLYFAFYMASVEFFVYWQHRLLHDIKAGYKHLHHIHHKYNKEHTLSPFAGLAFHPFDGILQAIPYSWTLFFVPMHFLTHELLLFATAIWTTNIHDCLHGKVEPIMGAGYHTIHHTTYKHNYGHYFTYMDRLFGSLISPEEFEKEQRAKNAACVNSKH